MIALLLLLLFVSAALTVLTRLDSAPLGKARSRSRYQPGFYNGGVYAGVYAGALGIAADCSGTSVCDGGSCGCDAGGSGH